MKIIALHCGCSENAARSVVKILVERGIVHKVKTTRCGKNGKWFQGNNHYYILDLPTPLGPANRVSRRGPAGDGGEVYEQDKV